MRRQDGHERVKSVATDADSRIGQSRSVSSAGAPASYQARRFDSESKLRDPRPHPVGETQEPEDEPTIISARRREGASPRAMPPPLPPRRPLAAPPPAAAELQPGTLISGQYLVERVVGSMGACVLVKVRHARLGQRFNLKYLTREASREPDAVTKFLHAARAAMSLQGEHIARMVDAGCLASGLPYVITEAFQGSELREVLRVRGALAQAEAVDVVLQAAEALAVAHRHGVVHGSLSPSTLFVACGSDGLPIIKVLDFGSSETLRSEPLALKLQSWNQGTAIFWESSRLWDTLAYSAPEQLRSNGEPTPLSDVWALGATLYELLSGARPFHSESASSLLAAVVADEPVPLTALCRRLPQELEAVVLRCLSKEPHARFGSVADLAAALRPFASAQTQPTIDRIARIGNSASRQPALSGQQHAMVRVGPSVSATPAAMRAPAKATPSRGSHPLRSLVFAALAAAAGLGAGAVVARSTITWRGDAHVSSQAPSVAALVAPPSTPPSSAASTNVSHPSTSPLPAAPPEPPKPPSINPEAPSTPAAAQRRTASARHVNTSADATPKARRAQRSDARTNEKDELFSRMQ